MREKSPPSSQGSAISNFIALNQIITERASETPSDIAAQFFYDEAAPIAETRRDSWTWQALHDRARGVAKDILGSGTYDKGARFLVVYPPGLGFIATFLGCLYAGMVPVPVPAPKRADGINRWLHVASDADISGILCPRELADQLAPLRDRAGQAGFLSPEAADPAATWTGGTDAPEPAAPTPDTIAFLQYTSGSTSNPKGVMVTHGSLIANLEQITTAFGFTPADCQASWLPHYHDMGLILGILVPFYAGYPVHLMSPAAFLRRPLRFLELAEHCRASVIGGPSFSYQHCVDKYVPETAAGLDLSRVRLAYNAAEMIRPETLRQFSRTFAPHGFRHESFYCCYGQAEATLISTCNAPEEPPHVMTLDRTALTGEQRARGVTDGTGVELAGCGRAITGLEVATVDPQSGARLDEGTIGEVWMRGPNVTPGYWRREETNAGIFDQSLEGTAGWFRTGDLGFLHEGQLYITGRLKEVIVIRGQNHHPEDIEQTVSFSHPALAHERAGVFAFERDGEERIGVVCELDRDGFRTVDTDEVLRTLRGAVSRVHDVKIAVAGLIRPGSLPRTPSGKVRRHACREGLLEDKLPIIARWQARDDDTSGAQTRDESRRADLRHRIRSEIARLADLPHGEMPAADMGFFDLGLDSVALAEFGHFLEAETGESVESTLLFEHPTIDALVAHLIARDTGDRPERQEPALPEPGHGLTAGDEPSDIPCGMARDMAHDMAGAISAEMSALRQLLRNEPAE